MSGGAKIWPIAPDWGNGLQETLAWSSDVMQASATAVTQHRSLRIAPQRNFAFQVLAESQEWRVASMLLTGYSGIWQLPIWPDVQWLTATLTAGATSVPCNTIGFDFVAGGQALLYASVNSFELVTIASIASDHISLSAATVGTYGPGSRLYPVRSALAQPDAQEGMRNDLSSLRNLSFDIIDPCDWAALSGTTYLSHPVLTLRPDESTDPTSSNARLLQSVDYGTSTPLVHDLPNLALRIQQTNWKLYGRAEHTAFRSLLYTLQGRQSPIWLPSFNSDLLAAASIAGGSTALSVEWAGYTLFGLAKANRKDLRIELTDGTVLYRRITAAVEAGATETLTLSASLDAGSIAPSRIRSIGFTALSTLASDSVAIQHDTDAEGIASATLGFQAVVPDV